jgi:hypothetical protein
MPVCLTRRSRKSAFPVARVVTEWVDKLKVRKAVVPWEQYWFVVARVSEIATVESLLANI